MLLELKTLSQYKNMALRENPAAHAPESAEEPVQGSAQGPDLGPALGPALGLGP